MASYRWTCNACGSGNEPETTHCSKCECSATAGAEEIEKHKNPEAFRKKKAYKSYESYTTILVAFPAFLLFYSVTRSFVVLILLVISAVLSGVIQFKLLALLWRTRWARITIVTSATFLTLMLSIRVFFIEDESNLVWLIVFLNLMVMAFCYYSLFKSQRGKLLFEEYYNKNFTRNK